MLVCDKLEGNILIGYDLLQKHPIPAQTVLHGIRESLRLRYNLTEVRLRAYKYDPIDCACDHEHSTPSGGNPEVCYPAWRRRFSSEQRG